MHRQRGSRTIFFQVRRQPLIKINLTRVPRHQTAAATDREPPMKSAKMSAIVLAVAVAGMASMSIAHADEAQAKSLFKAMSDYLAAQKAISFDYDSNLEIVSTQQQKIGLASSGTLTLNRPAELRLRNLVRPQHFPYRTAPGIVWDRCGFVETRQVANARPSHWRTAPQT
jgi:hypothetical protein